MRFIRLLKREPPLVIAREALWRARRQWNKRRILGRRTLPGYVKFRGVPYYNPSLGPLSEDSRALIISFADEVRAGRFPFLGYGTLNLGRLPRWNVDFVSGLDWPQIPLEISSCVRFDGSDVKAPYE